MPPNVWPAEVESFKATFLELFAAFDSDRAQGARGDRPLSEARRGLFRRHGQRRQFDPARCSIIRRSPATAPTSAPARTRTSTPSPCCSAPRRRGCELLDRDGDWLPVTPKPGELAVNIGDMLQRLTNNVLRSTTHRVVNPPPERRGMSRYSMPFFLHFRSDFLIETAARACRRRAAEVAADHRRRLSPGAAARDQTRLAVEPFVSNRDAKVNNIMDLAAPRGSFRALPMRSPMILLAVAAIASPAAAARPVELPAPPALRLDVTRAAAVAANYGAITSIFRSVEHNRAVGGVANSYHLLGRAIDVVRRPGVSHSMIAAALQRAGYMMVESLDEGDHSHFAFATSSVAPKQPEITIAAAMVKPPEKPKYPDIVADDHGTLRIDLPAAQLAER